MLLIGISMDGYRNNSQATLSHSHLFNAGFNLPYPTFRYIWMTTT